MKKILLPFEGSNFPTETLEFSKRLNELSPIMLTGAFVPEVDYAQLLSATGGMAGVAYIPPMEDEGEIIEKNSARLEDFCRLNNIRHAIHTDRLDFALPSIRQETRFADLLVLSSQHFFENINPQQPNAYMKEILHTTECPVMLLPEEFDLPDNIVLAYDGSPSSVYAIKQFIYLFPELLNRPATLVYLSEKAADKFPDEALITELVGQHFRELHLLRLKTTAHDFFKTWIPSRETPWLVTGSYGRSDISLLFSKSFIAEMIRDHRIPVFMAHS